MYDFHIHSEHSMDSSLAMKDIAEEAISKNLKSICFTDHIDLESTKNKIDLSFRFSDYFRNLKQVKYRFAKDIEILAGVEIGIKEGTYCRYDEIILNNPFDFVIISIHEIFGINISSKDLYENYSPREIVFEYYSVLLDAVKGFDNFDVLGHIDFIDRYFENRFDIPRFEEYVDIIDEIFKLTIEKGKGIELNTSGKRMGLSYFHPKVPILRRYLDLGGEIITIGSDTHTKGSVADNFRQAEKLLKDLGFKYFHIFKERKKFPINIS